MGLAAFPQTMNVFINALPCSGKDDSLRQKNLGSSLALQVPGSDLPAHVPFKVLCREMYAVSDTMQNFSMVISLILFHLFDLKP